MYKKWNVMALIPARGGSKGIPHKNLRPLAGIPLVAHSILVAKQSKQIDRVVVSTDSPEIAEIAKEYGAEVPFLRPGDLAEDSTPDFPVFEHCLEWFEANENYSPDIVVHLRPTGPLRTVEEIENGIQLLCDQPDADSVRSVNEPHQSPYKMWTQDGNFLRPLLLSEDVPESFTAPRQILPRVFETNANLGVTWQKTIDQKRSILGDNIAPLMTEGPVVDIDSEFDLIIAEQVLEARKVC